MRRIAMGLTAMAMLGAGLVWWQSRPARPRDASSRTVSAHVSTERREQQGPARDARVVTELSRATSAREAPAGARHYRAALHAANDYMQFAAKVLPAAKGGDPEAQYYLARALAYCESLYEWFFIEHMRDGKKRVRTLDEAQQSSLARPPFTADDVRDMQARCEGLRGIDPPPFGTATEWFEAARISGYPEALADSAVITALQSIHPEAEGGLQARDEVLALSLDALRGADPLVMMRIGEVSATFAGGRAEEAQRRQLAWMLAAVQRAGPGDEMREWMRFYCQMDTQCQPYETPADVIRRKAGNDLDEVERRAREINEKIDAGTLAASDIG